MKPFKNSYVKAPVTTNAATMQDDWNLNEEFSLRAKFSTVTKDTKNEFNPEQINFVFMIQLYTFIQVPMVN